MSRCDICVVGKGESLLNRKDIGKKIDSHDIVIRVNSLPSDFSDQLLGKKTSVLATRCHIKLEQFLKKAKARREENFNVWICSEKTQNYSDFSSNGFSFISEPEFNYISSLFFNFLKTKLVKQDISRGFVMPDTGITALLLAVSRFPLKQIAVCGFDLYKNGNLNLYETRKNSSLFLTPVLQQILIYKHLIKKNIIRELV